jgi:hypothetical protein
MGLLFFPQIIEFIDILAYPAGKFKPAVFGPVRSRRESLTPVAAGFP